MKYLILLFILLMSTVFAYQMTDGVYYIEVDDDSNGVQSMDDGTYFIRISQGNNLVESTDGVYNLYAIPPFPDPIEPTNEVSGSNTNAPSTPQQPTQVVQIQLYILNQTDTGAVLTDLINYELTLDKIERETLDFEAKVGLFMQPIESVFPNVPCQFSIQNYENLTRYYKVTYWITQNINKSIDFALDKGSRTLILDSNSKVDIEENLQVNDIAYTEGRYWCTVQLQDIINRDIMYVTSYIDSTSRFNLITSFVTVGLSERYGSVVIYFYILLFLIILSFLFFLYRKRKSDN